MSKHTVFTPCVFIPFRLREQVPSGAVVYDVSSYADHPFCTLSPMWPHGGIPVPGMTGTTSDSVEGIWQGLKIINNKIAPRYFSGQGHKRGGKPRGHQYGDKLLKLVEAREKIYRVSYEWMLEHRADLELIGVFIDRAFRGERQYFHDVSNNGKIGNSDEGWAHAAVLVQYLNRRCQQQADDSRVEPGEAANQNDE
ncbi:MAG TPA: hypothetical protein VG122_18565 [Gemmata sp.]|jgi:hypothetical protein|nr:hypothetical protein [Gemmata sp.]